MNLALRSVARFASRLKPLPRRRSINPTSFRSAPSVCRTGSPTRPHAHRIVVEFYVWKSQQLLEDKPSGRRMQALVAVSHDMLIAGYSGLCVNRSQFFDRFKFPVFGEVRLPRNADRRFNMAQTFVRFVCVKGDPGFGAGLLGFRPTVY